MTLGIILGIASLGLSLGCYFGLGWYQTWWLFFVPILMIPLAYLVLLGLFIVYMYIASLFYDKNKIADKPNRYVMWVAIQITHQLLFLFGARIHVKGRELLPKKQTVVFFCNHLSDFDQFSMISAFYGYPMIWISKPENFDIPIAGPWMAHGGYLPINREDPMEGVGTIRKAGEIAKENLASVGICPEGTRSKDHHLHDFKPGSFRVATLSEKTIVAVAIRGTEALKHNILKRRTHIYLDVVSVRDYNSYKDLKTPEISEQIHSAIFEDLKAHGAE